MSRIQDSYFLDQLLVFDCQLKNASKNIRSASHTKSTVLLMGYGIQKEAFKSKLEPGSQRRIRTFDSGMAVFRNWHFLINPF